MPLNSPHRYLLALLVLTGAHALGASPCFNILDYGAHPEDKTDST
jgi:hypothetical protein